jgi:type IV pilus assembly protein PilO
MRNLSLMKQRFIIALAIMAVVDVALVTYLMWPGSSPSALEDQRRSLQEKNRALKSEVAPVQNMDVKLAETRKNIKAFYQDAVPHRSSQIAQQLEKLKKATGVNTQSIRYGEIKAEKGDLADVQRVSIETTVTGDYGQVARFINALEQSEMFFIIEQINLTGQDSGIVSLQIRFQTFLKETA